MSILSGDRKRGLEPSSRSSSGESLPKIPPPLGWKFWVKAVLKPALVPPTILLRRRKISRYLAETAEPKLHVGCGGNVLPGWLNTDIGPILSRRGAVYLDARKRLPFADRTFNLIFNEHFIFSLTLEEAMRFLKECYRVLQPSGILRTVTPTWSFLVELWKNQDSRHQDYVQWATREFLHMDHVAPCLVINNFLYGFGYKSVLDRETLIWMLSEAGFSKIAGRTVGESPCSGLRGVEGHGKVVPPEFNELETTVLEATKA
ncbi:MAG: methyltransferase domain-containing protein [Acidobacteria bacterium]|nr:methyltransferase domain-containing protein [Acidobacteriota bacterium]